MVGPAIDEMMALVKDEDVAPTIELFPVDLMLIRDESLIGRHVARQPPAGILLVRAASNLVRMPNLPPEEGVLKVVLDLLLKRLARRDVANPIGEARNANRCGNHREGTLSSTARYPCRDYSPGPMSLPDILQKVLEFLLMPSQHPRPLC